MAYDDTILIKLRRDYSKDEVVMYALNQLKEKQTEIGKLKSHIQELEDNPINLENIEIINTLKLQICSLKNKHRKSLEKPNSDETLRKYNLLQKETQALKKYNKTLTKKNHQFNQKLYCILANPQNFNSKTLEEKMDFLSCFTEAAVE